MEIWHRISLDADQESILQKLDLHYERGYDSIANRVKFVAFSIAESHPAWPQIKRLISPDQTFDFIWTKFSQAEILNAEWLTARAAHTIGSPVPEGISWNEQYYERSCSTCGVGWRQKAPFHIKKEPHLGKNVFASFHGAFELFCTPEVLRIIELEAIRGYEVWPVLLHKTGEPSQSLHQLIVPNIAQPALIEEMAETEHFRKTVCPICGNVWYSYYVRGQMPMRREALYQDVDFQLTHEWFGNSRTARREILVSGRLARLIVEQKWKGLDLWPVQVV
jgi:hypothetical protein